MTATTPRAAQRSSPLCGTARAPHPRLACDGSPGRAIARMAGSPLASLRPPGTRRPRGRRRGKGAKGGRKAASLAAAPAQRGSAIPLPFPSSSPSCSGFFCERRGQNSATGRSGWKSAPSIRRLSGARRRGSPWRRRRDASPRSAPPVVAVRGEVRRGRLSSAEPHALSSGCETLDFDKRPKVWPRLTRSRICAKSTGRQVRSALRSRRVLPVPPPRADDDIAWRTRASANSRGPGSPVLKSTGSALGKGTLDPLSRRCSPQRAEGAPRPVGNDPGFTRALRFGRCG
jgi:hypothetical protein